MHTDSTQLDSPWPHRMAVLLCCATFPLLWVGGLVTTYDAGMSVPDWPNTYGYNLFLYPWESWIYGPWDIFIEHGHRLFAATVGLLTIALVIVLRRYDRRPWMHVMGGTAFVGVILQGALGGARVIENKILLAKIHGCIGPAFFALCVAIAVCTSRRWLANTPAEPHPQAGKLHRLAISTSVLAYLQLVIGAQLRHLPAGEDPGFFRGALVFHLIVALSLVVHAVLLAVKIGARKFTAALAVPAKILLALLCLQLLLGVAAYVTHYGWPAWAGGYRFASNYTVEAHGFSQAHLTTAHVATGSLILGVSLMLSLRAWRLLRAVSPTLSAPAVAMRATG